MADVMFNSAEGTVTTLLGHLTTILANEARLVRSVHSEVQFIKDEMESMHAFLVREEEEREANGAEQDQQLRAWTKQVKDLAYGSQTCVDKYVTSVVAGPRGNGLVSYILEMPFHVLKTLPARRRIASQIRELKVRAREVGERRLRYGVEIPMRPAASRLTAGKETEQPSEEGSSEGAREGDEAGSSNQPPEDDKRRYLLVSGIPMVLSCPNPFHCEKNINRVSDQLVRGIQMHIKTQTQTPQPQLQPEAQTLTHNVPFKVFLTLSSVTMKVPELADKIIKGEGHYSVKTQFECTTYVSLPEHPEFHDDTIEQMLSCMWCFHEHIPAGPGGPNNITMHNQSCFEEKKTLVFVKGICNSDELSRLLQFLDKLGCANGSAIVLVAPGNSLGFPASTRPEIIHPNPTITYYLEKACDLLQDHSGKMKHLLTGILARLCPDDFRNGCRLKMFLHFLYAKPACTREELIKLHDELKVQFTGDNVRRVMVSCFHELPTYYKGCLAYLTAFQHSSPNGPIKRERVTRQWVFHGLLSDKDGTSAAALHQADRCFDALLDRGFISPVDTTNEGKVKTFETPKPIMDYLLSLRSTSTSDSSYEKWGHHDKIRSFTEEQRRDDGQCGCYQEDASCWKWNGFYSSDPFRTDKFVGDLLTSPRIGGVEVLDLQGCRGLKKRHLRGICTTMIFLKYLSLKDTDVEELPRVIEDLNYLEMLDIRETKVRVFTSRVIKVKKLKHLLAGNTCSGQFFTLSLPVGIGSMSNLEVLSHVHVPESRSDGISQLRGLHLRKLGVLLHGRKDFNAFLSTISELCGTLQSLSVRVEQPFDSAEMTQDQLFKSPVNLQSLSISGIKHGLPTWIKGLHQLEKVTLEGTYLKDNGFKVLGELTGLRKLRIHKNSCIETTSKLTFAEEQFKSLKFLLIDCPAITDITFSAGAAPEAQNILWSYTKLQSISGVEHLSGLKEFHLKGDVNNIAATTREFTDENTAIFKYI